jgi:uncharacterized protein
MATKKVLLLSDGKPGHFQLAEGIVAALVRRSQDVVPADRSSWSVARLAVARPWWQPTGAWSMLTNSQRMAPERALSVLSKKTVGELQSIGPFQLVVSAGGDTLAANVAAKRMFQCPNVFYGSLRRYRANDFSLALTSYVAQVQHANQAMTLKPSAFDPDTLRVARAIWREGVGERPVLGLLVGGNSGTVRFDDTDWASLLTLLGEDHPAKPQWVVANSRRTPTTFSDGLAELAARTDRVQFIDVRAAGPGTLLDLFDRCDAIAVSVDSSSMVSEAVWSRRPVVVLAPQVAQLPALEADYRADLARQSLVATVDLAGVNVDRLLAAFHQVTPLACNPLDALASLMSDRLPELFVSR